MASVIDIISQGVATPELNKALLALTSIFGEKMINGVGTDGSMLVNLSAALNPLYIGLLFMVLAYIGVGGVINSAMEGRFLGRWSSVGVPGMFMLCLVLLSPIPTQNGVTLGQFIFVKSLKFGSNAADYILYKVFDSAGQQAAQQKESYSLAQEHIPKVNQQMSMALLMYLCGENLKAMGYGTRVDYFILLNKVCGIPADLHGTNAVSGFTPDYQSFFMLIKDKVDPEQNALDELAKIAGLPPIKQTYYSMNNVNANAIAGNNGKGSQSTQQLACHFSAFRKYFGQNLVSEVTAGGKVTGYGIKSVTTTPTQVNANVVPVNIPGIEASWALALNDSYNCLLNSAMQGKVQETYTPSASDTGVQNSESPWKSGWVDAAMAIQDSLEQYKSIAASTEFPLLMNSIQNPDYSKLGDNLTDKKNASVLVDGTAELYDFLMRPENSPMKIASALASARTEKFANSGSSVSQVILNNSELARIAATGLMATRIESTNRLVRAMNSTQKTSMLTKIFNSLLGKAATTIPSALGATSKVAVQAIGRLNLMLAKKDHAENIAKAAGDVQFMGISVGKVFTIGKAIYDFIKPSATTMTLLSITVIALNAVILLPQLVMLLVLLLWMARAAVWYMIIPLACVIIALPNTRAGHDIWKSALSIILTPALALVFYLVSLFLFDQMYSSIFTWIFAPIIGADETMGSQFLGGAVSLLESILTGELIFRVMMGFGVAIAVTMYMSMMILKGPDLVTRSLGLSGSSGDLGQDLENLRHSKTMNLGSHNIV